MVKNSSRPSARKPSLLDIQLTNAQRKYDKGDFESATSLATAAGGAKGQRDAALILAKSLMNLGRDVEAELALTEAIRQSPKDYGLHILRTNVYWRLEMRDMAAKDAAIAMEIDPDQVESYLLLADILHAAQRYEEAAVMQYEVVKRRPADHKAFNKFAFIMRWLDKPEVSAELVEAALQLKPGDAGYMLNLIDHLMTSRQYEKAVAVGEEARRLHPNDTRIMRNHANTLKSTGRNDEALALFEEIVRRDPQDGYARHLVNVLSGKTSEIADQTYVQQLFDGFAANFDEKLVNGLQYRVPGLVSGAVKRYMKKGGLSVLDLGCGTGLCAMTLREDASYLKGVDLSPKMVEIARERGLYDDLVVGELVEATQAETRTYDAAIAGDVFVYFGDLRAAFQAVRAKLRDGGLFVFSVERQDGCGSYVLRETGRYAHDFDYITQLSQEYGFDVLEMDEQDLRMDKGKPIAGLVNVLRAI